MTPRFDIAHTDPRGADARFCLTHYYAELARRFDGGFDVAQSRDPDAAHMEPPHGLFLLATDPGGAPMGCAGLKGGDGPIAEIKRVWIAPSARGQGLARLLMQHAETGARDLGLTTLRLDTNRALPEAIAMYHRLGWTQIDRFNDDPYAQVFFEKHL